MITLLFVISMCMVFMPLLILAFKATWGLTKVLFSLIFLPVAIIILFIKGAFYICMPLLIVAGIITLIMLVLRR